MISWIRFKHRIKSPLPDDGEFTVAQLAAKFGVSQHVVYYWLERKLLDARRIGENGPYFITIDDDTERKLQNYVTAFPKLSKRTRCRSHIDSTGGPPKAGEVTVAQIASRFGVSNHVVYYWIECNQLSARRSRPGGPLCIMMDEQTAERLEQWVTNSSRLQKKISKSSQKKTARGAK